MNIVKSKIILTLGLLLGAFSLSAQEPPLTDEGVSDRLYNRSLQMSEFKDLSSRLNHLWMAYQVDSTQPAVLEGLGQLLSYMDMTRGLDMMEEGYRRSGYDHQSGMKLLQLAVRGEDWVRAKRISERLLRQRPGDKVLHRFLVTIYEQSGQLDKALEQVHSIEGEARDATVVFKEAELLSKLGRSSEAEELLQKHLATNPGDPLASMALVTLYSEGGMNDKALSQLKVAQEQSPNSRQLSELNVSLNASLGNNRAVQEEVLRVAQLEGSDPSRAQALLTTARSKTDNLTKLLPTIIETELELQKIYGEEDRFSIAAANDYLLLSDTLQAEGILAKLVEKGTELPSPYYYFVEKYAMAEAVDRLEEVTTKGLKVLPKDGLLNLYSALVSINRDDTVTFAKKVRHAVEVVDQNDAMYGQLALLQADLLNEKGDRAQMIKYYEIAIERGIPTAYNNYAYALTTDPTPDNLNKAEEMARLAVQHDSENGSFLDTYAWILYLKGAYPLAKIYMERAISKEPEPNSVYYEHYADILTKLGEYDAALQALRKALESGGEVAPIEAKILQITEQQNKPTTDEK